MPRPQPHDMAPPAATWEAADVIPPGHLFSDADLGGWVSFQSVFDTADVVPLERLHPVPLADVVPPADPVFPARPYRDD